MPQATYHFPRGFLWGTATAAHQVEGNNTNNQWWKWEEDGHTDGRSGLACDWWGGRWKEDFDRAAEGGQNAHRFSVEWSRIQPTPDTWDEDALEHYRNMLRGLERTRHDRHGHAASFFRSVMVLRYVRMGTRGYGCSCLRSSSARPWRR